MGLGVVGGGGDRGVCSPLVSKTTWRVKLGFLRSDDRDSSFSPLHLFPWELARSLGYPPGSHPALEQDAGAQGRLFPRLQPQHLTHVASQGLTPCLAPTCRGHRQQVNASWRNDRKCPHWWSNGNMGEEDGNALGGKPHEAWTKEPDTQDPKGNSKTFTSDSRQDMNFKTTCLRYSKLISRASVRSALFVTEGAMLGISGPGFSRTSKSSLSGLIF